MTNEKIGINIKKNEIFVIEKEENTLDGLTRNLSRYIKDKGINVSKMSRDTGIPYMALYDSLLNDERERDIRGGELIKVCAFLGVNPMDFADSPKEKSEE